MWERAGGRGGRRQGCGHAGPSGGPLPWHPPQSRRSPHGPGAGEAKRRRRQRQQPYLYAQSRPSSRLSIGRPRSAFSSPPYSGQGARRLGRRVVSPQAEQRRGPIQSGFTSSTLLPPPSEGRERPPGPASRARGRAPGRAAPLPRSRAAERRATALRHPHSPLGLGSSPPGGSGGVWGGKQM